MHLHRLEFAGIGPFPDRHVVDFAALSVGGLFLLEGPTGSGKSTIIDAVTFALYGQVAGRDATADRLRSSYCTDDQDSYVQLDFATGSGTWRVWRSPERSRAKKRGEGRTKQQAAAKLWRLTQLPEASAQPGDDPGGDFVSNRIDEIAAEIQRAIGLTKEQFVQTMVLPQGEFAAFLRADPEKRGELLQRIFGTQIYQSIEQQLDAMRQEASRAVEDAQQAISDAIQRFATAARLTEEQRETLTSADAATLTSLIAEHQTTLTAVHQTTQTEHTQRLAAATDAETAYQAALQLHQKLTRRTNLLARKSELAGQLPHQQELQTKASRAHAANAVAGLVETRAQRVGQCAQLRARVQMHHERMGNGIGQEAPDYVTALAQTATADLQAAAVDTALHKSRLLEAETARLSDQASGLVTSHTELTERETVVAQDETALAGLDGQLATLPEQLRTAQEDKAAAEKTANRQELLAAQLAQAAKTVGAAKREEKLGKEISQAQNQVKELAAAAEASNTRVYQLRKRRIANIAGELAADLNTGEPCPVCGAREHPEPASLAEDHVSEAALEQAEQEYQTHAATHQALATELVELRTQLTAQSELTGGLDRAEARAQHGAVAEELTAAQAAAVRASELAEECTQLAEQINTITQRRVELSQRIGTEKAQLDTAWAAWRKTAQTVAQHLGMEMATEAGDTVPETLANRAAESLDRLTTLIADLETLDQTLGELDSAITVAADAEQNLAAGLTQHGFQSRDERNAAAVDPEDLTGLEEQINTYLAAVTEVDVALKDPQLAGLPTEQNPDDIDVEQRATEHETARAALTEAAEALTRATDVLTGADREANHITTTLATHEAIQAAHAPTIRLANLANARSSDNPSGLSLRTFVLMKRFEDVVDAANSRLLVMSGGRLELRRSDDKEARKKQRIGLALRVWHHDTNTELMPGSLSGGEAFYVSLCLALGLADVVTGEAGGVELGTLFVDEGFGTLDPEVLEAVISELHRLHASGRVVGIVSHVEGLKTAIAERIEVRRTAGSNSTLTVHA